MEKGEANQAQTKQKVIYVYSRKQKTTFKKIAFESAFTTAYII